MISKPTDMRRQLADQMKTAFTVGLLCLYLAVLKPDESVSVKRGALWPYVVLTLLALLFVLVVRRNRKFQALGPGLWVMGVLLLGVVWFGYWVSGVQIASWWFWGLALVLFSWSALLLLAVGWMWLQSGTEEKKGRVGGAIEISVRIGAYVYQPLSLTAFVAGIVLGWARIWNAGTRDWWMQLLLVLGVVLAFAVALAAGADAIRMKSLGLGWDRAKWQSCIDRLKGSLLSPYYHHSGMLPFRKKWTYFVLALELGLLLPIAVILPCHYGASTLWPWLVILGIASFEAGFFEAGWTAGLYIREGWNTTDDAVLKQQYRDLAQHAGMRAMVELTLGIGSFTLAQVFR